MLDTPPPLPTKRRITRIAPLQAGKILGVLYGILGLLIIPFFLFAVAMGNRLPAPQRVGFTAFGAVFAFILPVFYGAIGFIFGALGALIYNVVAKGIGGIEVEVE